VMHGQQNIKITILLFDRILYYKFLVQYVCKMLFITK
jgi:hypothetical protein